MTLVVFEIRIVPGAVVSLAFHVTHLNLPFFVHLAGPTRDTLEVNKVAELVERQVGHLVRVAIEPVNVLRAHHVVESTIVRRCEVFDALTQHMSVKLEKHANQRNISRRHAALRGRIVDITETVITRGLQPSIETVEGDEHVELVLVVDLQQ